MLHSKAVLEGLQLSTEDCNNIPVYIPKLKKRKLEGLTTKSFTLKLNRLENGFNQVIDCKEVDEKKTNKRTKSGLKRKGLSGPKSAIKNKKLSGRKNKSSPVISDEQSVFNPVSQSAADDSSEITIGDFVINLKEYISCNNQNCLDELPVWRLEEDTVLGKFMRKGRATDSDHIAIAKEGTLIDLECDEEYLKVFKINSARTSATIGLPAQKDIETAIKKMKEVKGKNNKKDESAELSDDGTKEFNDDDNQMDQAESDTKQEFEDYVLALIKSALGRNLSPTDRTALNKIEHNPKHSSAFMQLKQKIKSETIQRFCRLYCHLEIDSEEEFPGFKMDCMACDKLCKGEVLALFRDPLFFDVEEGSRRPHNTDDNKMKHIFACFVCKDCSKPLQHLHYISQLRWLVFDLCAKKIAVVKAKRSESVVSAAFPSELLSIPEWFDEYYGKLVYIWGMYSK